MILNRVEFVLMNNSVRAWIQKHFEGPRFRKMGGAVAGGNVLELGCGRGVGTQIILQQFGANHVDAVDLDPAMIALARTRLKASPVELWVGDATQLDEQAGEHASVVGPSGVGSSVCARRDWWFGLHSSVRKRRRGEARCQL